MKQVRGYLLCPRCWNVLRSNTGTQLEPTKKIDHPNAISVDNPPPEGLRTVSQLCPNCGNTAAFHWLSRISGEHAGVRRERTITRFRCTKCSHVWTQSF